MSLLGSNPAAEAVGLEPLETVAHYLVGDDQNRWHTNVPAFARVEYREVYPGVNLVYYGRDGLLEYDFVLSPGADPAQIRVRFDGAQDIQMESGGDLVLRTAGGEYRHSNARVYQLHKGTRKNVQARLVLRGSDEIAFDVRDYDRAVPLVIDPTIAYSTYLGGSGQDAATSIALDNAGNTYITGWTESIDFLGVVVPGFGVGKSVDAYVAKFNPAGGLLYITYLGGSREDRGYGIAVDSSGSATVTGWTYSTDFPMASAAQARFAGGRDGFVAKLNAAGSALVFSTYVGGTGYDSGNAVALDPQGNIYVAGETVSVDFPVLNPVQSKNGGSQDAFVAKFSSAGVRQYATYIGGVYDDRAAAIAVDIAGNAYVTGGTYSPNFPIANAFQPKLGGGQDAFVSKLNTSGNGLLYSTYLGGSGGALGAPETGAGIAVDSSGCAYVAGNTSSTNFPTSNPLQSALAGSEDAFLVKLSAAGSALVYGTYLGGHSIDFATGIAADASGAAYLSGYTASLDFPVVNAVQLYNAGGYDAFIAVISPLGNTLQTSTYYGGIASDSANAIAVDSSDYVGVVGQTQSTAFPVQSAIQPIKLSGASAFVAKMTFTVANPQLISPSPGATLSTASVTFTWNPINGAQDYWIDVGTAKARGDIASGYTGGATSVTINLTGYITGRTIYVQLYSKRSGVALSPGTGAIYEFATTSSPTFTNPQLISPAAGTVLSTPFVTFQWNPINGVQDYWIDVGTYPTQGDIAAGYTRGATSVTVNLTGYMTGRTIYIQLYSQYPGIPLIPGGGSQYHFVTAASPQLPNPQLVSPAPGTILATPSVIFSWNAITGAQDYWIDVGTVPAQGNIASGYTRGATSVTVNLTGYMTGRTIYVQLYSKYAGINLQAGTGSQFTFLTTGTQPLGTPRLLTPPAGAILSTPTVTFTWNAVSGAQDYWIDVGTAPAQGNIVAGYTGGNTSTSVHLDGYLNGQTIYIQIYAKFPGIALVGGAGQKFQFATKSPTL